MAYHLHLIRLELTSTKPSVAFQGILTSIMCVVMIFYSGEALSRITLKQLQQLGLSHFRRLNRAIQPLLTSCVYARFLMPMQFLKRFSSRGLPTLGRY